MRFIYLGEGCLLLIELTFVALKCLIFLGGIFNFMFGLRSQIVMKQVKNHGSSIHRRIRVNLIFIFAVFLILRTKNSLIVAEPFLTVGFGIDSYITSFPESLDNSRRRKLSFCFFLLKHLIPNGSTLCI